MSQTDRWPSVALLGAHGFDRLGRRSRWGCWSTGAFGRRRRRRYRHRRRFLTDVRTLLTFFYGLLINCSNFIFRTARSWLRLEEKVTQTSFLILSINILQLIVQGYLHQSAPLHQRIIVHIHIPCHQPTKHSSIINQNKHCRDTQGKTWLASLFTTNTQASILHSLSFINW